MKLSIITINYNNKEGLKATMNSVLDQTYSEIEYIIIDGGSNDGSKELIEKQKESLIYWVSEADKGVYDAMNKGIDQSDGDYLLFLNSGDWFVNNLVVEKFVGFKPKEKIVYGDHLVKEEGKWRRKVMPEKLNSGIALTHTINHQSIFFSKDIFKNNRYNLEYKILADWVLINDSIIFKGFTTRYIDLVICCYDVHGMSSDFNLRSLDRKRYLNKNFDPVFLSLLKSYNQLNIENQSIRSSRLMKISLWILQKKGKLIQYFRSDR